MFKDSRLALTFAAISGAVALLLAAPGAVAAPAAASVTRKVTFVNEVSQTIWVAASPDADHRMRATGWVLKPGHSLTVFVPNKWNGRFWGRTGCHFKNGHGHCQTGDCGGLFQCTGYGAIPATLAEYNLDAWMGLDFYDVSMVDGSNLPMYINVSDGNATKRVSANGCVPAGCTKAVSCPKVLQIKASGKVVDDDATSVYVCKGNCDYRIVFGISPKKGATTAGRHYQRHR